MAYFEQAQRLLPARENETTVWRLACGLVMIEADFQKEKQLLLIEAEKQKQLLLLLLKDVKFNATASLHLKNIASLTQRWL